MASLSTIRAEIQEDSEHRLLITAEVVEGSTLSGSGPVVGAAVAGSAVGAVLLGPVGLLVGLGTAAAMGAVQIAARGKPGRPLEIELRSDTGGAYREHQGALSIGEQQVALGDIAAVRVFNEEAPLGPLWTLAITLSQGHSVEVIPRYRVQWDRIAPIAKALAKRLGLELNA